MLNKGRNTSRNEHQCGNRTEPQDYRLGDWMMRMKMCLLLLKQLSVTYLKYLFMKINVHHTGYKSMLTYLQYSMQPACILFHKNHFLNILMNTEKQLNIS